MTASVAEDAAEVIGRVFEEAERRGPEHRRRWVALVDGNCHQVERIEAEAAKREVQVAVVVDLIHVLEYLWGAVWCSFAEGDAAAEAWVRDRALAVLEGTALDVAAGIRRRATAAGLAKAKRKKADDCAKYLVNKAPCLHYPAALVAGWPIATGVIEGTCRYIWWLIGWTSPAHAGASRAPRQSSNYGPSGPTAIPRPTGVGTWTENDTGCMGPVTSTAPSLGRREVTPREPHPMTTVLVEALATAA
ncbi:MAG: hypothetical protein ACRD2W_02595 [Acidimicrobiales bacterium]